MKISVLNGVNLKRLGKREPDIYGRETLREINKRLKKYAATKNTRLSFFCTDSESKMIQKICDCKSDAIVINPGAWSHYSYALRDAVAASHIPVVEVHLSDITTREPFRKIRVLDGVVSAVFFGEGVVSYEKAINFLTSERMI